MSKNPTLIVTILCSIMHLSADTYKTKRPMSRVKATTYVIPGMALVIGAYSLNTN